MKPVTRARSSELWTLGRPVESVFFVYWAHLDANYPLASNPTRLRNLNHCGAAELVLTQRRQNNQSFYQSSAVTTDSRRPYRQPFPVSISYRRHAQVLRTIPWRYTRLERKAHIGTSSGVRPSISSSTCFSILLYKLLLFNILCSNFLQNRYPLQKWRSLLSSD